MASPTSIPYYIPTYVRLLCSEWTAINTLIIEHGTPMREKIHGKREFLIPEESYLNDALNGPYQPFLETCLNAHARVARIRLELTLEENDLFKRGENVPSNPARIPQKILKKCNLAECDNLTKKLSEHIQTYAGQWRESVHTWSLELQSALNQAGLKLTDIEIQHFNDDEPISDLHNRFIELKLEKPTYKREKKGFSAYFILKLTLAIHSILSRLQQPHGPSEIEPYLKSAKSPLEKIHQEETQLLNAQKTELNSLIAPVDFLSQTQKAE